MLDELRRALAGALRNASLILAGSAHAKRRIHSIHRSAWPTPPPSAMEATRIGFWLFLPRATPLGSEKE
jgi:hypothetical protein